MQIILPKAFTAEYQDVLTRYLVDDRLLDPAEWRLLYQGIDILDTARIQTDAGAETFRQAYHHHVDASFATPYRRQGIWGASITVPRITGFPAIELRRA